jgi:hypothetical protein
MKTSINIKLIKQIAVGVVSLVALYFFILLLTRKPKIPIEVQEQLKTLQHLTDSLQQNQKKYDTAIVKQQEALSEVTSKVDHIKDRTTVIKEYYHDQIQVVKLYTPTELDSFFKARYNY